MLKRIFLTLGLTLALLLTAVLLFAATRPDSFRVERSITIAKPPEAVFPLIDNFHRWEPWSPWEKIDPKIQRSYSGAESGQGAVYAWQGNGDVGAGRMAITASTPSSKIVIALDFTAPFEAHNTVEFTLEALPGGAGTRVTQAMFGPSPYVSKLMGLFFSMDKMVGGKYEEGLASLKQLAER